MADVALTEADWVRALAVVDGLLSPAGLVTLARRAMWDLGRAGT